jgi:hypothetical protein
MSTDFRSLTPIRFADLFDGRLDDTGVYEHQPTKEQFSERKCLTDGRDFLWAYHEDDGAASFTCYRLHAPQRILRAIAEKFDVDIVSEHEPEYWGFETIEEWDAAERAMRDILEQEQEQSYQEIIKFVEGKSRNTLPDTIEMAKAEIAKRLIDETPTLRGDREELIKAICASYNRDDSDEVPF